MQTVLIIVFGLSVLSSFGFGIYLAFQDRVGTVKITRRSNRHGEDM